MTSRKLLAGLAVAIAALALLPALAGATYAGDRPLAPVYQGELRGGFVFTPGTSVYNGSMGPGSEYNVTFDPGLPGDAMPVIQRLYIYWTWSNQNGKAMYPNLTLLVPGPAGIALNLSHRYMDNKGFVSSYDYYVGTDAYEIAGLTAETGSFTVIARQDGPPDSSVAIYGMGLLVVYESASEPRRMLWVREGCDLQYSSYGITPEMATNTLEFPGDVPVSEVDQARLFLVAPSGGYSRSNFQYKNSLMVNKIDDEQLPALFRSIMSILFPNFRGKAWSDVFDYDPGSQIGIDDREIRPYLRSEGNRAELRDSGDYLQLSNAVLSVTMKS